MFFLFPQVNCSVFEIGNNPIRVLGRKKHVKQFFLVLMCGLNLMRALILNRGENLCLICLSGDVNILYIIPCWDWGMYHVYQHDQLSQVT